MTVDAKKSGIPTAHATRIEAIAAEKSTFILIRAVNPRSLALLVNHKVKGLDIHGKSADWGPQAAYIPVDAALSKAAGNPIAVAEGNKSNKKSVGKGDVRKTQLLVTITRLEYLKRKGCLMGTVGSGQSFKMRARRKRDSTLYDFVFDLKTAATKTTPALYKVSYFPPQKPKPKTKTKPKPEPLLVVGYKSLTNVGAVDPVTADFDLFAVCPHHSAVSGTKGVTNAKTVKGMGRISKLELAVLNEINSRIIEDKVGAYPLVRHGPESGNLHHTQPASGSAELVMFSPDGSSKMVNGGKVATLWSELVKRGFYCPVNSSWTYNTDLFSTIKATLTSLIANPSWRGVQTLTVAKKSELKAGGLPVGCLPVFRTKKTAKTQVSLEEFVKEWYGGSITWKSWG
jgi:Anthrax toxin LF subunit